MQGLRKKYSAKAFGMRQESMGNMHNLINSCDKRCIFLLLKDGTAISSFSDKSLATFCETDLFPQFSAIFETGKKIYAKEGYPKPPSAGTWGESSL